MTIARRIARLEQDAFAEAELDRLIEAEIQKFTQRLEAAGHSPAEIAERLEDLIAASSTLQPLT